MYRLVPIKKLDLQINPVFQPSKTHTTYFNKQGSVVPSVTTILQFINKPELVAWANFLGFRRIDAKHELDFSARIGSATHTLIEDFTKDGTINDIYKNQTGPERPYIHNAFQSFLKLYVPNQDKYEYKEWETKLTGDKYGGTMDALLNYDGKLTLGDYKTSKKFYLSMFIQLAAYDILLRETRNIVVDQYMVFQLDKKKGNIAKIKIIDNPEEMEHYREFFKSLFQIYYHYTHLNQKFW